MATSFLLDLDTRAPVITWGALTGTTAGELFQQAYEIDEPGIVSATLTLADARELEMTDEGDKLVVLLPPDAPDANMTMSVLVRDEMLNEATRTRTVSSSGVVIEPEPFVPHEPGGLPAAARRDIKRRTVSFDPSIARVQSSYRQDGAQRRVVFDPSTAVARTDRMIALRFPPPVEPSSIYIKAAYSLSTERRWGLASVARVHDEWKTEPGEEWNALLALDIL